MAGLWARASILLRDYGGNVAKVIVIIAAAAIDPSGGAISAITTALQALTNAVSPRRETGTQNGEDIADASAGKSGVVEDRMVLTFRAEDGSTEVVEIPGPTDSCFNTNSDIVNPDNAAVAALIDYIESNGKSLFNQGLTFVKGFRSRKHQMKR